MSNNDNKNSNHYEKNLPQDPNDCLIDKDDKDEINTRVSLSEGKHAMEAMIIKDPLKDLRKTMKPLYANPLEDLRKSIMALYSNPLEELHNGMKALYANPLEDFRKSMKVLYIDPLEDLRKSMKTLYVNPLEDLHKRMKTLYVNPLEEFRKSMKALYTNPLEDFRKSMESMKALYFENPLKEIRETILKYSQIADAYKNIFISSIPANTFEEAYQEVLSKFFLAQASRDGEDITEAAIQVAEEIKSQGKTYAISKVSFEFYLNLFVALVFFLHSLHLSKQAELRLNEAINKTQITILERINEIKESEDLEIYYVVERTVNLRTKPTTKNSVVLKILYPNQKVRLIERKGKWIKVEYYNHILDIHENGWCFKKYLKKLH